MSDDDVAALREALGSGYEVFRQWDTWLVAKRGLRASNLVGRADSLYRTIMRERGGCVLLEGETRRFWENQLAGIAGL